MKRLVLLLAFVIAAVVCGSAQGATVWLCHPAKKGNPCTVSLDFTAIAADASAKVYRVSPRTKQPIDCFYVYPTVSLQRTGNSNLKIEDGQIEAAQSQAAWFSPVCRVFAPMYRQTTAAGNTDPSLKADPELAYADVRAAWRDYLARENRGRGFVLIGHSQGGGLLKRLIQEEIENDPGTRRRLVSALLLGTGVVVQNGSATGGDFQQVPACRTSRQVGCVVAYSAWHRPPPQNASFQNVANPGRQHILCVNPAAPAGGRSAAITPIFLTTSFAEMGGVFSTVAMTTDWVSYPGLYHASCKRRGSMSWLEVTGPVQRGDKRATATPQRGAAWGLHSLDVNIALFELVALVGSQAKAYAQR